MNEPNKLQLLEILKQKEAQGIPFAETKQVLLKMGYSEAEISHALFEASYDGKPNLKIEPQPATKHFLNSPEESDKVAKTLLKDLNNQSRTKMIIYGLASKLAPGKQAQSYYEFKFFEELGLPYFRILLIGVVLGILVIKFDLPELIMYIFGLIIISWIIFRIVQTRK